MQTLLLMTWLAASTPTPLPEEPRPIGEFLLLRKDGGRIEGHGGSLAASRFTGLSAQGAPLDIAQEDIQVLYRKEGSQAGVMAAYGAGAGLALSGIIVLRTYLEAPSAFRNPDVTNVSLAVMGGSTVLGAVIGLAVGAGQSNWRVEPLVAPGQKYALHVSLSL